MNIIDAASLTFSVVCNDCDASAFHAVTAAWATKGYWMQAEMIHYLGDTGLGIYASLLYILAVGAGLIGYMLGNPPRNYLWYLFGPALFNIMLFTTVQSGGVNWQLGLLEDGSADLGDQKEVWKLAEVGLLNMNIKERLNMQVYSDRPPEGGPFGGKVEVAHLFLWLDDLVSDFVQGMIGLMGANFIGNPDGSANDTNINSITGTITVPTSQFQEISRMKWGLLQNITGASIKSPVMAKTLGVFLGSECGDILSGEIDQAGFTAAARSKTGELPDSVFIKAPGAAAQDYGRLKREMDKMWVSVPEPLRALYKDTQVAAGAGNSLNFFSGLSQEGTEFLKLDGSGVAINDAINCTRFFSYLVEAMRWESGNAYFQLIEQAPSLIPKQAVAFALFYGWGVREKAAVGGAPGAMLTAEQLGPFMVDLMLVHIVKNLFEYTPVSPDQRYSPSEEVQSYIELQQKTTSSTTKFAEVYSWSLMIPYVQGLVMYFLAMAYPIVCVAMIMPGLHKLPLTWVKYWIWIKIWDLGFALVQAVERSVWAMMSNNERTQRALSYVVDMKTYSEGIEISCEGTFRAGVDASLHPRGCEIPVSVEDIRNIAADAFTNYIMPVFDRALTLSVNLQLDLSNSYYIYIMAALYFAVPALAGQLVGSAGGIASGALDKMTDVKGAAGAGYTSDMNQRMAGFAQSMGQEMSFKGQRSDGKGGAGFGSKAIQQANAGWAQGQGAGELDALNAAESTGQSMSQHTQARKNAQIGRDQGVVNAGAAAASGVLSGANGAMQPRGQAGVAPANGGRNGNNNNVGGAAAVPGGGGAGAIPGGGGGGAGAVGGGGAGVGGRGGGGAAGVGAGMAAGGAPAGNGPAGNGRAGNGPAGNGPAGRGPAAMLNDARNAVAGHFGTAANVAFAGVAGLKGAYDIEAEQAKLGIAHETTDAVAGAEAQKARNSAGSAGARMSQGRMQADSARMGRAGSFAGSEAKWNAMNDLNTKLGGKLGVIGLNFSPYGAGSRSDDAEGGAYANRMNYGQTGPGKQADSMNNQAQFYGNGNAAAQRIDGFTKQGGELNTAVGAAVNKYQGHDTNTGSPFKQENWGKDGQTAKAEPATAAQTQAQANRDGFSKNIADKVK